jgi:hypothetical protein
MGRYPFGGWESTSGHSGPDPRRQGHDIAQVCVNGHMINTASRGMPEHNKPFCDKCGEKTITSCPSCNNSIRGLDWDGYSQEPDAPPHCEHCGKPFPWTERKKAAALELFAEVLDMEAEEQREELKRDLDAISTDQPRTQAAALKLKRMLTKAGKDALGMVRDMVVDIGSEIAVKTMYPDR